MTNAVRHIHKTNVEKYSPLTDMEKFFSLFPEKQLYLKIGGNIPTVDGNFWTDWVHRTLFYLVCINL